MLKLISAMVMLLGALSFNAQAAYAESNDNLAGKRILIAYYSLSGNTQEVAEAIQKELGGDLFEIETAEAYPDIYKELTEQAKREISAGYKPALKKNVENPAQYDIVFIGSPIWWGTIAPAVSSFLAANDFAGKTVIPFVTHGGGGVQNSVVDLQRQCQGCMVNENGWVGHGNRTFGIAGWLKELGFKE
jgi:flavodoxin